MGSTASQPPSADRTISEAGRCPAASGRIAARACSAEGHQPCVTPWRRARASPSACDPASRSASLCMGAEACPAGSDRLMPWRCVCRRISPATVNPSSSNPTRPMLNRLRKSCSRMLLTWAMASTSRPSATALRFIRSWCAGRPYQSPNSSNSSTAGSRLYSVVSGCSMRAPDSANPVASSTSNSKATRAPRRELPVQACQAGCKASHHRPPRPMASSCVSRTGRSCSQNPPWIRSCAHKVIARCATTSQTIHSSGWRSPRQSGSVNAAHSANSCQVSAPVW